MMQQPFVAASTLLLLALATTVTLLQESCHAYVFVKLPTSTSSSSGGVVSRYDTIHPKIAFATRPAATVTTITTALLAEADNAAEGKPKAAAEEEEIMAEDATDADDEEEVEEEEEQEEEQEDPEVTKIKEEISVLEKTLKEKKSQIQYLKDSVDTYSKAGYARKVAEMENMRRARSSMASSNKETSIANVLRSFLPVQDKLEMLREQYGNDEFGKQYVALAGNFKAALTEMGVTEYAATVGEPVDRTRVLVLDEQPSEEYPPNTVIKLLKMGLELKGNVIRLAECVASLGVESKEEEEEGEAAGEASTQEDEREEA